MELYQEILLRQLEKGSLDLSAEKLVEMTSYQTLKRIKAIIEDDSLDDIACFHKIEKIVCAMEEIGSDGGNRHDFG